LELAKDEQLLEGQLRLLDRKLAKERGITVSVLDAVRICDTEYCCVIDGDMQHPPQALVLLIEERLKGAELVIGTRAPYQEDRSFHRSAITKIATWTAMAYLYLRGMRINDPMSGFFVVRTELVKGSLAKSYNRFELRGYKILFDLLRILPATTEIKQVYFDFMVRTEGESKLRAAHAFYFARSIFRFF